MGDNAEWHKDQSLGVEKEAERKAKENAERKEILETYKWIKVPKYYEVDPNKEDIDWKAEYQKLMEHHKEETEFLIKKVRKIIK